MPIECRQTEKRPCRHHRQIGFASVFPYMGTVPFAVFAKFRRRWNLHALTNDVASS